MAILKRSKQSILGLDVQLANIETNVANNATNVSNEVTRATGAEATLTTNVNSVTASVNILNADNTTTGSVDKKISDATASLSTSANTYTKAEVDTIASTKVDSVLALSTISVGNKVVTETELNLKANSADIYTQTQVDTSLAGKADSSTTYTKTEVDTTVATLATTADTYTKTETDTLVSPKANSADVYTKTESDTNLLTKLNTTDTVTAVSGINKVITQTELATKANVSDVYTKTESDTNLLTKLNTTDTVTAVSVGNKLVTETEISTKANSADVYTQTQIDAALTGKADSSTSGKVGPSLKIVDETNIGDGKVLSYNVTSGQLEYVVAADPAASSIDDSSTALDSTWSSTKINTELGLKANTSDVYTQAEVDSKVVASAFGIKYSVADTTTLNALTGMSADELAVNNTDRNVYKYDGSSWNVFYALDGDHNHDTLYYTKSESDTSLSLKADQTTTYTKTEVDGLIPTDVSADLGKVGPSLKIVDETNIADGKVISFNSSTGQLEYVAQTAGGVIDDATSSTTTTYSSNKIDTELNLKANAADVYTKTESDTSLSTKVNTSDVLTATSTSNKIVTETELTLKADAAITYTSTEVDTALAGKVNTSDVLTAIAVNNKVVTQTDIAGKADSTSVYTKTESDTNLATKANSTDVYTKTEVDTSLSTKLNTSDTVSTVDAGNKIVTQSEITTFANTADVYTKTEVDAIALPKFDDAVALSTVSAGNKLVTETELLSKVNTTDVKTTITVGNKVVTESDLTTAIDANNATLAQAPILVVDRPTMSTASSNGLDYVFTFALSKTPHGLVAVNDEITIYNFTTAGDASLYEGITLFADKHAEIAVTLASTSDESLYVGKTIKVCYLTTETTVTPGTDALHPIIIDAGVDFEAQGSGTTSYSLDYSVGSFYRVTFTDGYYTNIHYDLSHTDFHINNTTDYQAFHYNTDPTLKSQSWVGQIQADGETPGDEVQYITYNWTMELVVNSGSIYDLQFTQNAAVGGGAL